ncbi:MAG: hypothetical protein PHO83_01875 [Geobacteraceae bacterium]|nr:hypothetical protein [Geobacteraceae bacterium]
MTVEVFPSISLMIFGREPIPLPAALKKVGHDGVMPLLRETFTNHGLGQG